MDKLKQKIWLRIAVLLNFILLTVPFVLGLYGFYVFEKYMMLYEEIKAQIQ